MDKQILTKYCSYVQIKVPFRIIRNRMEKISYLGIIYKNIDSCMANNNNSVSEAHNYFVMLFISWVHNWHKTSPTRISNSVSNATW